ncbi:MAG: hypothetical protein Q8N18_22425, partial [Opitutaceae bacterium]|nr:hypothetical protein [Opitutaceae bacterium]
GKLFGSCPRKRPNSYPSTRMSMSTKSRQSHRDVPSKKKKRKKRWLRELRNKLRAESKPVYAPEILLPASKPPAREPKWRRVLVFVGSGALPVQNDKSANLPSENIKCQPKRRRP